jgi:tetratricopeptide (TPR) repeat protein
MSNLGDVVFRLGRHEEGRQHLEQASGIFAAIGDQTGVAWCCNHLGDFSEALDCCDHARRQYHAGLDIFRAMGNRWGVARSACDLGHLACKVGDFDSARGCFREALTVFGELAHKRGIALALEGFARLALEQGQASRALTLAGAASALRRVAGAVARPQDDRKREGILDLAATHADAAFSTETWRIGCRMPLEKAIDYALTP